MRFGWWRRQASLTVAALLVPPVSCSVCLWVGLSPSIARASNGVGARTPPVYPAAACVMEVDRSSRATFTLPLGLVREDLEISADEPPDSRRLQFFAICRDEHPSLLSLPNWVRAQDVETALQLGLLNEAPPASEVLPTSTWSSCALPLNSADARVPIACEAVEDGLVVDASAWPAGNYVVRGYTYEPALNLWTTRRGVLAVHDGQLHPAVGLTTPVLEGVQLRPGDPFPIDGCTVGPPGLPVWLQWAPITALGGADDEAQWVTFAEFDSGAGAFSVPFNPPEALLNRAALVRAVIDPLGPARWVDHAEGTLLVFGDNGRSDEPIGEPFDRCEPESSAPVPPRMPAPDPTADAARSPSTTGPADAPDSAQPSGCRLGRSKVLAAHAWLIILLAGWRGRRRLHDSVVRGA